MSECGNLISTISDIAVSGAAVIGAVVAWKGLGTWRQQLKGANEYELARRILKCTYHLRDAIAAARSPVMFGGEMPKPPSAEATRMGIDEVHFYGKNRAYEERWRNVQEKRSALRAELLEAEALWGAKLKPLFQPLFTLQHELWVAIHLYIKSIDPDSNDGDRQAFSNILRENHGDVMYDLSEGEEKPDRFAKAIQLAISAIEEELRKHLTRG